MEVQQLPGKLLRQYESIRRQEHEEITALLDTLARVDGLPESQMEQVRDALFHTNHPFLMVLVGPFSSGKSSIINALLGQPVLEVGPIPTTDRIVIVRHGADVQRSRTGDVETVFFPSPLLENLSLVDTPGLESVFRTHEALTRRFLHRADVVLLVMLATQVLSARNLEYLQELKGYGKRVIIVVNQVDLLDEPDRARVREFVEEQSRLHLGVEPLVWLVSARQALEAQQSVPRDEIEWDESGFAEIEAFINESLSDVERFRQKLETPVQISENAVKAAQTLVDEQQAALDTHRKTTENIEAQIEQGRREQQRALDDSLEGIERTWDDAIERGSAAIGELSQFSRGFASFFGGLGEIIGIARLIRRFGGRTRAEGAFEDHKVRETLREIPRLADRVGPRLEGRDLQDIDDLVDYTRTAVAKLPTNLQDKIVGKVQTPLRYERSFLRDVHGKLDDLLRDAERFETTHLDRTLRNTLIILALWEILVILLMLAVAGGAFAGSVPQVDNLLIVLAVGIGAVLLGLALVPLRGWFLRRNYERRLRQQRDEYMAILRKAAEEQIAHGVQLRRDATAPFTRMMDSQAERLETLRLDLAGHQRVFTEIQRALSELERRAPAPQPLHEG